MCGIIGFIGERDAVPILVEGLQRLEYRGYDSVGIAVYADGSGADGGRIEQRKTAGRIAQLEEILSQQPLPPATLGIGHTRWATHGRPCDRNAHPHSDDREEFFVVHNGIIENYQVLRRRLAARGRTFTSDTDSEVIPHLISEYYRGDLVDAVRMAVSQLAGSFALAVMSRHDPDVMVAVRQHSPLVVGLHRGEFFVSSDIPAILPYTREACILHDGEMAVLRRGELALYDAAGRRIDRRSFHVDWTERQAALDGFHHFMLKEIHEQPAALADTLQSLLDFERVGLDEAVNAGAIERIHIVGCGSAYHAGLIGRNWLEHWACIPTEVELASEFRYRRPFLGSGSLIVAISQSGETADTLAAGREGKRLGAPVLAITNVIGSSLTREADAVIYTRAGPEIAVASTKAYTTQLLALALLALHLAGPRRSLPAGKAARIRDGLRALPGHVSEVIESAPLMEALAHRLDGWGDAFFIGRGVDYAVAMEGQLKLKEVSYIHAEALAAGELKHGTLALIEEGTPVIALATQPELREKTLANVAEVKARGADVTVVVPAGAAEAPAADRRVVLPPVEPELAPVVAAVPLQLLAYYAAVARGADVDRPRHLAKSVTVE